MSDLPEGALARLARLESLDAIRELAAQYALCVDMADLDLLVDLYVEDVEVGRGKAGRAALRDFFAAVLGQFDGTAHQIGNHIIELDGEDRAEGVVYCLAQHETKVAWVVVQCLYHDWYERHGGEWLFRRRIPLLWYAVEPGVSPVGPGKVRWPGQPIAEGNMHAYAPAWAAFHGQPGAPADEAARLPGRFLERLRRGQPVPRAQVPRG